jgi:division protein CdvB (Snf7/Vps24/ESCRT-III family)
MDIPKNLTDLTNLAKSVILQNDTVEKVAEEVDEVIEKVEDVAEKVGLDEKVEDVVNMVEEKTGLDIDKDGDTGK